MATRTQHGGNLQLYPQLDLKALSSQKVARAASDVEVALAALGAALRERAQLRAAEVVESVKRRLFEAEVGVESLIARVPAVGPLVAMELFRATHATAQDDLQTRPSNALEPAEPGNLTLAYLECIGCHVA